MPVYIFGPNIGKMKEKGDAKGLIDLLSHDKLSVRLDAVRALFTLQHFGGLAKALENSLSLVRSEAASMLRNVDLPEVTKLLSQALLHEAEADLWQQVFSILTNKNLDSNAWILIGIKLVEEGMLERAIQCFDKALELNPTQEQIGAAGRALLEAERPREALPYFDRFVALASDDEQGWTAKGWCLAEIGQLDEALECVNTACPSILQVRGQGSWQQ